MVMTMKFTFNKTLRDLALCISASLMIAHSSVAADMNPDPLEPLNRAVFQFNMATDRVLLRPVATTYANLTPRPVKTGIGNALSNLRDVNYTFNALFQGRFRDAVNNAGRFVVNSTFGVAGIFDVATPSGVESKYADFGQTLSTWGMPAGPFLMLPIVGPSTIRDGAGFAVDAAALSVPSQISNDDVRLAIWGTAVVHGRAQLTGLDGLVTGDRYIFFRDAYLQRRASLLGEEIPGSSDSFDDFSDFGEFEDDLIDELGGEFEGAGN